MCTFTIYTVYRYKNYTALTATVLYAGIHLTVSVPCNARTGCRTCWTCNSSRRHSDQMPYSSRIPEKKYSFLSIRTLIDLVLYLNAFSSPRESTANPLQKTFSIFLPTHPATLFFLGTCHWGSYPHSSFFTLSCKPPCDPETLFTANVPSWKNHIQMWWQVVQHLLKMILSCETNVLLMCCICSG